MSISSSVPPRLTVGQRFPNIQEAAHHHRDYCNHYYTRFWTKESRPTRYIAVCGDQAKSGCRWEVRLYTGRDMVGKDRGDEWEITQCEAMHTCSGCQVPKWSSQNSTAWLARVLSACHHFGQGDCKLICAPTNSW